MDFESCFKVHNLVVIQLNNTKLGQMTNVNMIFYMVVSTYKLDKKKNSPQSPAQPQSGQLILLNKQGPLDKQQRREAGSFVDQDQQYF